MIIQRPAIARSSRRLCPSVRLCGSHQKSGGAWVMVGGIARELLCATLSVILANITL